MFLKIFQINVLNSLIVVADIFVSFTSCLIQGIKALSKSFESCQNSIFDVIVVDLLLRFSVLMNFVEEIEFHLYVFGLLEGYISFELH